VRGRFWIGTRGWLADGLDDFEVWIEADGLDDSGVWIEADGLDDSGVWIEADGLDDSGVWIEADVSFLNTVVKTDAFG